MNLPKLHIHRYACILVPQTEGAIECMTIRYDKQELQHHFFIWNATTFIYIYCIFIRARYKSKDFFPDSNESTRVKTQCLSQKGQKVDSPSLQC